MLEKWQRAPGRVGMAVGFLALPLLWWLRETLLQLAFDMPVAPLQFQTLHFFAAGAIPGSMLGAGLSKAFLSLRNGDKSVAKRYFIIYGVLVGVLNLIFVASGIYSALQNASLQVSLLGHPVPPKIGIVIGTFLGSFPLNCALLMLFIGLLMRSKRPKPAL